MKNWVYYMKNWVYYMKNWVYVGFAATGSWIWAYMMTLLRRPKDAGGPVTG